METVLLPAKGTRGKWADLVPVRGKKAYGSRLDPDGRSQENIKGITSLFAYFPLDMFSLFNKYASCNLSLLLLGEETKTSSKIYMMHDYDDGRASSNKIGSSSLGGKGGGGTGRGVCAGGGGGGVAKVVVAACC
jgi:hypothetical protein